MQALILLFFLAIFYTADAAPKVPDGFGVAFKKSMAQTPVHQFAKSDRDPQWQKAIELYDAYIHKNQDTSHVLIPKIIHQIWLGSPLPEKCKKLRATWIAYHPDWEVLLWTEKEIDTFGLENRILYDAATNYGEKSDIARYEILERYGGLYIDTDFECLQAFDYLHHTCDFYAGVNCGTNMEVFNGLFGSRPGHLILQECIRRLKEPHRLQDRSNGPMKILARTGPYFFTECIYQVFAKNDVRAILFPTTYFYAWPFVHSNEKNPKVIAQWIRPESMALHHWHSAWMK